MHICSAYTFSAKKQGLSSVLQACRAAGADGHLQKAIGEGFTNAGLEKELKKGLKPAATTTVRKKSFSLYRGSVQSLMTGIDEQRDGMFHPVVNEFLRQAGP